MADEVPEHASGPRRFVDHRRPVQEVPPPRHEVLRDRTAGTTVRISVRANGTQSTGDASMPAVSADGKVVAFLSTDALTPGAPSPSVFVRSLTGSPTTSLISFPAPGLVTPHWPDVSDDGRYVAFVAWNGTDSPSFWNTWVRDRTSGTVERVFTSQEVVQHGSERIHIGQRRGRLLVCFRRPI